MTPRIAIIGAGPGGAIALDTFLEQGYEDITLFERRRVVGGTWNLDEHLGIFPTEPVPGAHQEVVDPPTPVPEQAQAATSAEPLVTSLSKQNYGYLESPLYPQVETNVLAEMMSFSSKPFPNIHPAATQERFGQPDAFRTHDVVRNYVTEYFEGRDKYLCLNTTVERAFQVSGPGSKWKLTLRRHAIGSESEEWWTEEFDFLYAASGKFNVPFIPKISGLKNAIRDAKPGTIIHTKVFRDPELFKNKRIVLVGAAFSNVDIAHLVQKAGADVPIHLSLRNIVPVAVKGFAQPWIETHPQIVKVDLEPGRNDQLKIKFEDGKVLKNVHALILGTGYRYSYPYLEEYLKPYGGLVNDGGKSTRNLLWSTWWKEDSSLAVTSNISDSLFWRLLEAQAKCSSALWKRDRNTWPRPDESDAWEAERRSKGLYDFHIWFPHYNEILDGVSRVAGIDLGEYPDYNGLYVKGFGLKGKFWQTEAERYLAVHPEDVKRYDKTREFLDARIVTRF